MSRSKPGSIQPQGKETMHVSRSAYAKFRRFRLVPYQLTIHPPHVYHWLWWVWTIGH